MTVEEQIACRDWVVSIFTSRWTHVRRGTAVVERGISGDGIANGVVAEIWIRSDRLELFQQLGVEESAREVFAQASLTRKRGV